MTQSAKATHAVALRHRDSIAARLKSLQADSPGMRIAVADARDDLRRRRAQRLLEEHKNAVAKLRAELEDAEAELEVAARRVERVRAAAPKFRDARLKVTALGQEGERVAQALAKATGAIIEHVTRLREIGREIHDARAAIGLPPRREAWHPYEHRLHETILAHLWANLGVGDQKPPHAAVAKYVDRDGLADFFSAWRTYLPPVDDDSELPPAA